LRETFLPFALPDTDESEVEAVAEVIRSGWLTTGAKTHRLEHELATYLGARHAVAVNSCTAAMHLALEAVGVGRGDRVATTPYTFAATAEVIRYLGADPVFVDVEAATLNLDPERLRETLSRTHVKAILPVHVAGEPCDLDAINAIAAEHGATVIEDAAHALPTRYRGRLVGAISKITCLSFYATKALTTAEGGMILTDDDEVADRCRIMSLHGISRDAWKRYTATGSWAYEILAPGFKYNLSDVAAALGLAQLAKLERMWRRRQDIARRYDEAFAGCPELELPARADTNQHAWHLYPLRIHAARLHLDRAAIIEDLRKRRIGTSVHFIPLHAHPYYRETYGFLPEDFPVAWREYQREISLPIYSRMSDADVGDVINAVLETVRAASAR
jgi:dTDP-4-amino-4,6-dideoxygalactose transaminase